MTRVEQVSDMLAKGISTKEIIAAFPNIKRGTVEGYILEARRKMRIAPRDTRKFTRRTWYGTQDERQGSVTVSLPREPWESVAPEKSPPDAQVRSGRHGYQKNEDAHQTGQKTASPSIVAPVGREAQQ